MRLRWGRSKVLLVRRHRITVYRKTSQSTVYSFVINFAAKNTARERAPFPRQKTRRRDRRSATLHGSILTMIPTGTFFTGSLQYTVSPILLEESLENIVTRLTDFSFLNYRKEKKQNGGGGGKGKWEDMDDGSMP
jgi:hypothetical protein